jgi:hypothetical protein
VAVVPALRAPPRPVPRTAASSSDGRRRRWQAVPIHGRG